MLDVYLFYEVDHKKCPQEIAQEMHGDDYFTGMRKIEFYREVKKAFKRGRKEAERIKRLVIPSRKSLEDDVYGILNF